MSERTHVYHPERGDEKGVIVHDDRRRAWTPDDLTSVAPDEGMVKVRWAESYDPNALFWEYRRELTEQPQSHG